ncbi:amylo-alpha-1,6-glucosidase [Pedomonas sp. V897]|uniref:amylo-alpha-1,6-glucosidase n=1 Tax=Pedomonas sp. V897 TaxID=3446482 RepID=UPI003EE2A563
MQSSPAEQAAPASAGAGQENGAPGGTGTTASIQELRSRTLKHGDAFGVFNQSGDAIAGPDSPEGLYYQDTRHLSHLRMSLEGRGLLLLSSTLRDDNAMLTCDLTNPDLLDGEGRITLAQGLVHIRRSRFLWNGAAYERLAIRNYDTAARRVRLAADFAADFADLFEVRGTRRAQRGTVHRPMTGRDWVRLGYTGLDGVERTTHLRFEPAPVSIRRGQAVFDLALGPRECRSLFIEIRCNGNSGRPVRQSFYTALRDSRRALRTASARATAIVTSHEIFNEAVRRSISDLYMLVTDMPEGAYPYAGIPWFSTTFGRDAIITALETLWIDPEIARGVLRFLAANQATEFDPKADAQPGKILHEARYGEMARLGEVPFRRYYGSVDATPLFIMLAGAYYERTGDLETVRALWPHVEAALGWIDTHGDLDGDGFVEYARQTEDGLINQGWKDSQDSVFHADGTLARGPIALVEVQAYVYGAWIAAARLARALEHHCRADALEHRAADLRTRFDAAFFDEKLGTYVLALDGEKRPCRIRTSNAGHALLTGIALPERAPLVVETLMNPQSYCGWGIRTVAGNQARYNPMSYHNGSVWPHDNALVAAGFARYGFRREAALIFEGLFAASMYIDLRRLPELFCGFRRQRSHGPTFYPVACVPQAWAAAAPLSLLQSCLGIGFSPAAKKVTLDEPVLPAFLDEVELRGLRVAGGRVDIALRRAGQEVAVNVLAREGNIQVITTA